MNRNKFLRFLLFGLILVILIELGIIFIGNSSSIQISSSPTISPGQTSNLQPPASNSSLPSDFKILYQDPNDKEGRTVVYTSGDPQLINGWEGQINGNSYLVGFFVSLNQIPNEKDYYLTIEDENKKTQKIRILIESKELEKGYKLRSKLAVETIYQENEKESNKPKVKFLGSVEIEELKKLLKPNDVVVCFPYQNKNGQKLLDKNNLLFTDILLLRRNKEINKL